MDQDPETQYLLYIDRAKSLTFRSVRDGEVVAEVPLGHEITNGTSRDDMIATIGLKPDSAIIINDRHAPELQQVVALPCHHAVGVAISPALDTIAVVLFNGMTGRNTLTRYI